jgi:class 3 adenylate cyclase
VHAAARIGALAGPGEILASRETADGVGGFPISRARQETLKGFSESMELVSVDWR